MPTNTTAGHKVEVYTYSIDTNGSPIVINDKNINRFKIQCRTAVDLYLREGGGASDYFTIKSGTVFELDIQPGSLEPFHLTSGSGTVTVEIVAHRL